MFHYNDEKVRALLLTGNVGLEKESLRVDANGRMAKSRHPFPESETHIVRDFCENQTEVNTPVCKSAREAVDSIASYTATIQRRLAELPEREYLWAFSNPPYIEDEDDIPVAVFEGSRASKTTYRHYLADSYGKYKMAFSGIHFNFSFSDELLATDFALHDQFDDLQEYKNQLYLEVAKKAASYGWIITAVTAASPLMDGSFFSKGMKGEDAFVGMGSVRCSELGYWNHFAPVLSYDNIKSYAASIQKYVDEGLIAAPTELYYPIRLKPRGLNNLQVLSEEGVNHIELRMVDLNPLVPAGLDHRDALFIQLFLVFMASTPALQFDASAQVRAALNFKNAAHYDLDLVKIMLPSGGACSIASAGRLIVRQMKQFFNGFSDEVEETLEFQENKFLRQENRYPYEVRRRFGGGFWQKGLQLAKERQAAYV